MSRRDDPRRGRDRVSAPTTAGSWSCPTGSSPGRRSPTCCRSARRSSTSSRPVNRADLLSVYGIAREVAALFDGELRAAARRRPGARTATSRSTSRSRTSSGCPRYVGRLFRDVTIGPSPHLAARRGSAPPACARSPTSSTSRTTSCSRSAARCTRSTSHDARGRADRRPPRAATGEEMRTLDGDDRKLDARRSRSSPTASAPSRSPGSWAARRPRSPSETTSVLLEAANFEPIGILRSSERLGLRTEGSNRWEKGVDPVPRRAGGRARDAAARRARRRALDGARRRPRRAARAGRSSALRPERATAVLGLDVPPERAAATILERLGFEVAERGR